MATSTKFDSLSITAIKSRNRGKAETAQKGEVIIVDGPVGPPQLSIEYTGLLKYDIAGDVQYTTSVVISDMPSDVTGFTDVYRELQQYIQSVFNPKSIVLGNIRFTATTVTFRFTDTSTYSGNRRNLRQSYASLNRVAFSQIGTGFEETVTTFFQNIDELARGASQVS